ncbi:Asparagine-linked glycosylation protein 5 [Saitozyma sp. JCM 24511]|nr:Asparagine-linked glycosylation protein 5 [Saitozyma sp. JCM 24511]
MELPVVLGVLAGLVALGLITLHFLLVLFTPPRIPTHPSEREYTTLTSSSPLALPRLTDPHSLGLSIVVPAYNEVERLQLMLDEAMEYLLDPPSPSPASEGGQPASQGIRWARKVLEEGSEVLLVDDGSSDGTAEKARELAEMWEDRVEKAGRKVEIRVVRLVKNRGKGGAVQHGVCHSRGRLILFADADGASRFADLDLLLESMDRTVDNEGQGMVVGSRAHLVSSEAVVKRSKLRNLLMHGFHLFLRTLGVGGIRDTQCGFKLFTRPTALLLFPPLHLPRWSFDVELLLLASLISPAIPVSEIPIAWHEVNGSKIRLGWDSIGMARDLLVLRGNLALGRWKVPKREVGAVKLNGNGNGVGKLVHQEAEK